MTPPWDMPLSRSKYEKMVQAVVRDVAQQVREPVGLTLSELGRQLWLAGGAKQSFVSRAGVSVPVSDRWYYARSGWDIIGLKGRLNGAGRIRTNLFYIAPPSLGPKGKELYHGFRAATAPPSTAVALAAAFEAGTDEPSVIAPLFATVRTVTTDVDELIALIRRLTS